MKILNATVLLTIIVLSMLYTNAFTLEGMKPNKTPSPPNNNSTLLNSLNVCKKGFEGLAFQMNKNSTGHVEKQLILVKFDTDVISFVNIRTNKVFKLYKVDNLNNINEVSHSLPLNEKCFELEFFNDNVNLCVEDKAQCPVDHLLFSREHWLDVFTIVKNCRNVIMLYYKHNYACENKIKSKNKLKKNPNSKNTDEDVDEEELDEERRRRKVDEDLKDVYDIMEKEKNKEKNRLEKARNADKLTPDEEDLIENVMYDYEDKVEGKKNPRRNKKRINKNRNTISTNSNSTDDEANAVCNSKVFSNMTIEEYKNFTLSKNVLEGIKTAFDCLDKNSKKFVNATFNSINRNNTSKNFFNNTERMAKLDVTNLALLHNVMVHQGINFAKLMKNSTELEKVMKLYRQKH